MEPTFNRPAYQSPTQSLAVSQFMSKVFLWMTIGILLTAFVAVGISNSPDVVMMIATNTILYWGLFIAEIGLVFWLSARINKMAPVMATSMFLLYSLLSGVTLSIIFLLYTRESIASIFFTTAAAFAGLSAFGFFTKKDLGPVGNFCTMGLFGMVGFSLLSWIFPSMMGSVASKVYNLVGLIVFSGLTAWDTQKIKQMAPFHRSSDEAQRGAILGALMLYLDFINLFMILLRLGGNRRN
jgi:FtsH-binding integral membrane protein